MVKIFVGRLADSVDKNDLENLFKGYGEVTDCSVLKNYGFVHMADLDEAKAAITGLDKHELKGNAINVELSTTRVQKATKIFVGNLPPETKSADVHKLFKKYGTVIECDVIRNYAFVHMGRDTMAREAIQALNNTDYNGNKISVQMARPKPNEMEGGKGGPMFAGDYRGRSRGGGMHPMRPFMPPPHPPRSRMGMMGGGGPRGYMRKPGYMSSDPYMASPYMRSGNGRGGAGMPMRPRMHPSAAGGMPRDLGGAYDPSVGRRSDMMPPNPYMMRDREALAPPSAYPASAYPNSAAARYSYPPADPTAAAAGNGAAAAGVDRYAPAQAAGPGGYGSRAQAAPNMRYGAPPPANGRFAAPTPATGGLPATVADQYAGSY